MPTLPPGGRILMLSADPALLEAQLAGADLTLDEAGALRDDVSTDEITPLTVMTVFDERLGRYPYVGLKAGDRCPIGTDAVRRGGFTVTVAGRRYGKGSSREHSPIAELRAGIRLVIAQGFERIYRQNADNIGLFTSTDFGLVERIRAGEAIGIEELVASRDSLAADILRAGGLLRYGQLRLRAGRRRGAAVVDAPAATTSLQAGSTPPQPPAGDRGDRDDRDDPGDPGDRGDRGDRGTRGDRPLTLFEKIVARHLLGPDGGPCDGRVPEPGEGGFVQADLRFIHEYYTGLCADLLRETFDDRVELLDTASIVTFEDHLSYAHRSAAHVKGGLMTGVREMSRAHRDFVARHGLRDHGCLPGGEGSEGISHALVAEQYALPGRLVAGTDSHTPHSGALGCVAFGVGTTDIANAFVTGAVRFTMPEVLRIELVGRLPAGLTAKDIVLHLLAEPRIRAGAGVGKVFEFGGPVIAALSTDERATLTNMTAELGGFTGLVEPDAETVRFVAERRGVQVVLEPWMRSDPGARYAQTLSVDCSTLSPMVARPGDPGNGVPLAALDAPVRIDIAYGGSCTAGKREDFDQYHAVLAWAAARGLRVAPGVQLFLQFGTTAVRDYCIERGYLAAFKQVGAEILMPSCGSCANCGPGASERAEQVTVSAINRNFPGRSGPGQVWLASPPTVAASAIAGRIVSFEGLQGSTA
jgi:3-isopropylmalate/(R)-2-methylmalate dehydratase large subunit